MRNNIMVSIGLMVFLFIFLTTVHADSEQLYQVESATLALLEEPDPNAAVIAELQKGEKVTIFEESYGWGKTYHHGEEAWVAIHQLVAVNDAQSQMEQEDVEPAESVENGQLHQVKVPAVHLREAPDKNATIITELSNGEKVTIFGESYGWGKTFYNDKEAWIALHLLEETNESTDRMTLEENEEEHSEQTAEENETEKSEAKSDQRDGKEEESAVEKEEEDKEAKQDEQIQQSGEKTLAGYHFVIDPGHGGKDTGAIGSEVNEKTLTLSTAKKVEEQLHDKGASVTLTRMDDRFIPLEERVQPSNSTDTEAFISLHYNASEDQSVRGVYTFYYDGVENQRLASTIQKSLVDHTNLNDRGTQQADFKVLRDNKQLAVLIELGFISNPEEQKVIQTDNYQENAAKGIVTGLENYFK
ncbi:N-acetylmuramoyl-L-alanine amidase [Virgibacillus sp. NKC19-3]|uniref:N-acetylmuramoyl-L-alanine amidase n=1 Tax=Virgibacillus saliphilus TaxID=2831674 RepID=UPI001C9A8D33|nr:N-acetylmuramoyl-L-alanine amidase [Virgibacillus sp. NKC19-3]MBY7142629.1 N-acetylmuramoyl-L-alanine amidase [Virgibacillus sp. NKC19-3]